MNDIPKMIELGLGCVENIEQQIYRATYLMSSIISESGRDVHYFTQKSRIMSIAIWEFASIIRYAIAINLHKEPQSSDDEERAYLKIQISRSSENQWNHRNWYLQIIQHLSESTNQMWLDITHSSRINFSFDMWNEEHIIKRLLLDFRCQETTEKSCEGWAFGLLSLASNCKHAETISCAVAKFIKKHVCWEVGSVLKWFDLNWK